MKSNKEILEDMFRLRELYALKRVMRYASTRDHSTHNESVAEHLFGMMILIDYFLPLEDPEGTMDIQKILHLAIYHDIGEIETGDIVFNLKSTQHEEAERKAVQNIVKRLPERQGKAALEAFEEYERGESSEARFVRAIDKIEPIFELLDEVNMQSYKRLGIKAVVNVEPKLRATVQYPHMRACLDAGMEYFISKDAFAK